MNEINQMYASLIESGYGHYSKDIVVNLNKMVYKITKAKDKFKPEDTEFVVKVEPNTKVTIRIESL